MDRSCWRWLSSTRVSSCVAWVLNVVTFVCFVVLLTRDDARIDLFGRRVVIGTAIVLALRLVTVLGIGAVQYRCYVKLLRALNSGSKGDENMLTREELDLNHPRCSSPYLWLSFLLGMCLLLYICEIVFGLFLIAVLVQVEQDVMLLTIGFSLLWVAILVRLTTSSLLFRWGLLYRDRDEVWLPHHRARFGAMMRWICMFGLCQTKYVCKKDAYEPVLPDTTFNSDEITAAATALAKILAYRPQVSHHQALGLLGKIYYRETLEKPAVEEDHNPDVDLSVWEKDMLIKACELSKFAIGCYTGIMLDLQRGGVWCACRGCCYWCVSQRPDISATLPKNEKVVGGDNVLRGHEKKFLRYVRERDVLIRKGLVGQGACKVSYFLAARKNKKEIVLAIRGTQDLSDILSDALMFPVPLKPIDLGINNDNDMNVGAAHLGVLKCTRNLIQDILGPLEELVDECNEGNHENGHNVAVWVVGHSLGGSVSQLASYRLRTHLEGKAVVHGIAYQPLPSFDRLALRKALEIAPNTVLSIPFGDDIVSRLSMMSLNDLANRIKMEAQNQRDKSLFLMCSGLRFLISRLIYCFTKGRDKIRATETRFYQAKKTADGISERLHLSHTPNDSTIPRCTEQVEEEIPGSIYIIGRVIHVDRLENQGENSIEFKAYHANPIKNFRQIKFSPNMFADHVPWRLKDALYSIYCTKEREEDEVMIDISPNEITTI